MRNVLIYLGVVICVVLALAKLVGLGMLYMNDEVDLEAAFVVKQVVYAICFAVVAGVLWGKREI